MDLYLSHQELLIFLDGKYNKLCYFSYSHQDYMKYLK